jgi:glycosyltransferase involved in cell wall biosynthesis
MKIYSYLHSGVPVVATKLPTHTQVMDDDTSFLGDATVEGYAAALARAYEDPEAARVVGARARTLAESRYTFSQFEQTLNQIYDAVEAQVGK